jgi:lipoate-protein ligase A
MFSKLGVLVWKLIDTGRQSAKKNMEIDTNLLSSLKPHDHPILHFYDWDGPSASYGYFTKVERFFDIPKAKKVSIQLVRRPTGGGIIFHMWDLAFSVLLPSKHKSFSMNTLENYQLINNAVLKAVKKYFTSDPDLLCSENDIIDQRSFFCMAKPTLFDVILGKKKIAGAAQRRKTQGLLHQGSISIACPIWEFLEEILQEEGKVLEAMRQNSYYILGPGWSDRALTDIRAEIREDLKREIFQI